MRRKHVANVGAQKGFRLGLKGVGARYSHTWALKQSIIHHPVLKTFQRGMHLMDIFTCALPEMMKQVRYQPQEVCSLKYVYFHRLNSILQPIRQYFKQLQSTKFSTSSWQSSNNLIQPLRCWAAMTVFALKFGTHSNIAPCYSPLSKTTYQYRIFSAFPWKPWRCAWNQGILFLFLQVLVSATFIQKRCTMTAKRG